MKDLSVERSVERSFSKRSSEVSTNTPSSPNTYKTKDHTTTNVDITLFTNSLAAFASFSKSRDTRPDSSVFTLPHKPCSAGRLTKSPVLAASPFSAHMVATST
eukprot:6491149-Amphidinium_carterae.1